MWSSHRIIKNTADIITTNKPIGNRVNAYGAVMNSQIPSMIIGVRVTFNLTTDDKDKEEEIQLTVKKSGQQIGYGGFGKGTLWRDPGSYPCTVNVTPFVRSELNNLHLRMYKTPYGSDTGCGMEGSINFEIICEDNFVKSWFTVPERRYGDNNPYDLTFP